MEKKKRPATNSIRSGHRETGSIDERNCDIYNFFDRKRLSSRDLHAIKKDHLVANDQYKIQVLTRADL